ncbi:MAG: permease prefix domain 1-containing protein [Vagococcus sp.]|uniref:permease prefix domain 1-containing protein n=1 Tax=Vagococcus sp. TaxID=1933889 RepID=UPI002FC987E9
MNTIESYVETMFMNLPMTDQIINLKKDILSNMEEKYDELKSDGMSDNEAIGLVISEFGNIDELLNELEIDRSGRNINNETGSELPTLSIEIISDYIKMKKEIGTGIGFGVILCGIGTSLLLLSLVYNLLIVGVIFCLIFVAAGVAFFVLNGLKNSKFEYLEKGFFLEERDIHYIESESMEYARSFNLSLVIGIVICILSAIPVLIGTQKSEYILPLVGVTVVIATVGCFFLIYAGNLKGAYSFLLENGIESSISEEDLSNKLFWKKFNEKFWLIIVALYLLTSFVFNIWSISWIIFPVAGVLSGLWVKD